MRRARVGTAIIGVSFAVALGAALLAIAPGRDRATEEPQTAISERTPRPLNFGPGLRVGDAQPFATPTPICENFEPGTLWIGVEFGASVADIAEIAESIGGQITYDFTSGIPISSTSTYVIAVPEGQELSLIPQIEALDAVKFASVSCRIFAQ